MYKKYLIIIVPIFIFLIVSVIVYLYLDNRSLLSSKSSQDVSTGNSIESGGIDPNNESDIHTMPHNIGMQTYSFSNGKYRVSFLAAKNSIVESRHAGDIIRTIAEMKDFLSTTSYQQSTERIYNSPDRCNYAVFTGNYLSDPYCESTDKKCKYSYIEIHNLIDKEILETYVGRGIRAKIQDTNYAPYPNFSILNKDYLDVCYPIASITYARHDGRSLDYYIYNNEQAQKRIREWKTWAEGWEMIGRTKDGYPTYEYSSAIGGHYYYIELDDGDILSVGGYYTGDIRIHRIESPTLAH